MDSIVGPGLRAVTGTIEVVGVAIICLGVVITAANYLRDGRDLEAYHNARSTLGRAILMGLELLIAADIIQTVAVEPTPESVLVLGGVVLIRTFLSLSLEVEITGRWPWSRGRDRDRGGAAKKGPDH